MSLGEERKTPTGRGTGRGSQRVPTPPVGPSGERTSRPRLLSAPNPSITGSNTLKGRGRPVGFKTHKTAPNVNHSTIAQRTRGKMVINKNKAEDTSTSGTLNSSKSKSREPQLKMAGTDISPEETSDTHKPQSLSEDSPKETPLPETTHTPIKPRIDVSLGPSFIQSPGTFLSSTGIESADSDADDRPPIYDPRRSCLRVDESDDDAENAPKVDQEGNKTNHDLERPSVDEVEIEVTAAQDSESDSYNLGHSILSKEEVLESSRKFEESLRLHEEKTQFEKKNESIIMIPLHFSDGDKV